MNTLNVLIADRSPAYRLGIKIALQNAGLKCACWEVGAWDEVPVFLEQDNVDLLVLDARLPELEHFRQLEMLLTNHVELPVLILADLVSSSFLRKAHLSGVSGVALKSSSLDKLSEALSSVVRGGSFLPEKEKRHRFYASAPKHMAIELSLLSEKEKCVLKHLKDGLRNKHIGRHMGLSESTIKRHVSKIFRKLKVDNRTRLALKIRQMGWADSESHGLR